MKVSNKVGTTPSKIDSGKAEAASGLKKDVRAGALNTNKADIKNASNVNVSERAQMMSKAKEIASSPMSVDEAKVARLQKMIDEGTYKVDAQSIADKLVDEHLTIPD